MIFLAICLFVVPLGQNNSLFYILQMWLSILPYVYLSSFVLWFIHSSIPARLVTQSTLVLPTVFLHVLISAASSISFVLVAWILLLPLRAFWLHDPLSSLLSTGRSFHIQPPYLAHLIHRRELSCNNRVFCFAVLNVHIIFLRAKIDLRNQSL